MGRGWRSEPARPSTSRKVFLSSLPSLQCTALHYLISSTYPFVSVFFFGWATDTCFTSHHLACFLFSALERLCLMDGRMDGLDGMVDWFGSFCGVFEGAVGWALSNIILTAFKLVAHGTGRLT
jgi:hypothetical protein